MSFSVLAALTLVPLVLAPVLTHQAYLRLHARENAQIAADNAAIVLGRADRALFAALARAEARLRWLEIPHHAAHLCARTPKGGACLATDRALEAEIRTLHRTASAEAQLRWTAATTAARAELARIGVAGAVARASRPPLSLRTCRWCGLPVGWTVPVPSVVSRITASASKATVVVRERAKRWNYRLVEEGGLP